MNDATAQPFEEEPNPSVMGGELVLFEARLLEVGNSAAHVLGGFDEFWGMTVKKKSPATARKAYAKAVGKVGIEVVHSAWARHNRVWAGWPRDARVYIPYPATWLNAEEWDGDDPEPRSGGDSWADVTARYEAAAAGDMWGTVSDVSEPTYPVITITGNVLDDNQC